jgi:hypothetical protein
MQEVLRVRKAPSLPETTLICVAARRGLNAFSYLAASGSKGSGGGWLSFEVPRVSRSAQAGSFADPWRTDIVTSVRRDCCVLGQTLSHSEKPP